MAASYLSEGFTLKSWLTTHDHKRIAILFAIVLCYFRKIIYTALQAIMQE